MELELKHLAGYLPYGLKYIDKDSGKVKIMKTLSSEINMVDFGWGNAHVFNEFKPILRPLSDLDEIIEYGGEKFVPIDWIENKYYTLSLHKECEKLLEKGGYLWINHISHLLISHLYEWHFDVHNLIENGLAININELDK